MEARVAAQIRCCCVPGAGAAHPAPVPQSGDSGRRPHLSHRSAARAHRSAASQRREVRLPRRRGGPARPLASAGQCVAAGRPAPPLRRRQGSPVSRRLHRVLADRGVGHVVAGLPLLGAPAVGHAALHRRAGIRRQRRLAGSRPPVPRLLDGVDRAVSVRPPAARRARHGRRRDDGLPGGVPDPDSVLWHRPAWLYPPPRPEPRWAACPCSRPSSS